MQSPKLNYLLWGGGSMTPHSRIDHCRLGQTWGIWDAKQQFLGFSFLSRPPLSVAVKTLARIQRKSVTQMGWACKNPLSVAALEAGWWQMVTVDQNLNSWRAQCQNGFLTVALCVPWVLQAIAWYELQMPLQLEKVWKETHPTVNRLEGMGGGEGAGLALSVGRISSFYPEYIFLDYLCNC